MNKQEFLARLRAKLSGIPQDDLEERLNFYGEMIDDRVEEGLTEEQATATLGTIEDVYTQIMSEIPFTKLVKEKVKPDRKLRTWETVLLAAGSPLWLSLLLALLAIVIAVYAVIGSVILSLWAAEFSFAVCSIAGIVASVFLIASGNTAAGIALLGTGLGFSGLTIFGFFGCRSAVTVILRVTKRIFIEVKSRFVKKGATK